MGNIPVSEIILDQAGIPAEISKGIAAGMAQHMRMGNHGNIGGLTVLF